MSDDIRPRRDQDPTLAEQAYDEGCAEGQRAMMAEVDRLQREVDSRERRNFKLGVRVRNAESGLAAWEAYSGRWRRADDSPERPLRRTSIYDVPQPLDIVSVRDVEAPFRPGWPLERARRRTP